MTSSVRLYGRAVGFGSQATVTRGFLSCLSASDLLAGFVALDQDGAPDDAPVLGALSPAAVFTGPLGMLPVLRRGVSHRDRFAMVAPNSSAMPGGLLQSLTAHVTEILTPSAWAAGVLEEHTALPVRVVPHGIHAAFGSPAPAPRPELRSAYSAGAFDVLHLATSARERKSTLALIDAWSLLMESGGLPEDAKLRLVLDMEAASRTGAWLAERRSSGVVPLTNVFVSIRLDASPTALRNEYRRHHVVCQPSRGEGFGLCPLEALIAGVPIVATACTGHSEWFREGLPGAVRVQHGGDAPIDDLPNARAPEVSPDAIAAALRQAYEQFLVLDDAATNEAPYLAAAWSWERQLAPFMHHLKEIAP